MYIHLHTYILLLQVFARTYINEVVFLHSVRVSVCIYSIQICFRHLTCLSTYLSIYPFSHIVLTYYISPSGFSPIDVPMDELQTSCGFCPESIEAIGQGLISKARFQDFRSHNPL